MTTPKHLGPNRPQIDHLLNAYRHYAKEHRMYPSSTAIKRDLDLARAAYEAALAVDQASKRDHTGKRK